jgi:Holliday junction DNA helicase RuvA
MNLLTPLKNLMFAYINGKLVHKEQTIVVLETGNIGYEIRVSLPTSASLTLEQNYRLYTYLLIKEDAHTLYGFLEYEDKKLFLQLLSVSGVGANTAMLILSSLSVFEIKDAIAKENARLLQSVKGIGAKTAQQIILDLKDKIKKEDLSEVALKPNKTGGFYQTTSAKYEALTALVTLGIAKATAEKSIETIFKKYGENLKVEEIIRYALKNN